MRMVTRMREYRAKLNMTQDELAARVGVRRETIVNMENGRYNPSLRLAMDVAKIFSCAVEDVFAFVEDQR